MTFSQRLTNYADGIGDYLRTMQHVFLLSDMPGNIGDHLIWAGTQRLLKDQDINFRIKCNLG